MSPSLTAPQAQLPDSQSLQEFLDAVPQLSAAARYLLVEQALALLDGIYVHLRLKRSMHAVDPVQSLRLLQRRLPALSDLQFHAELARVFRGLRDLHTVYQLPNPFAGRVATLAFLVERYEDETGAHHIVTKVDPALTHDGFGVGAEISGWNGIPIERLVELNAERQAGSNEAARHARGLEALTLRSLRSSPPPDEHWADVQYHDTTGVAHEVRIPWRVTPPADAADDRRTDPVSTIAPALGIDAGNEATRHVKRRLFGSARARSAADQDLDAVLVTETRTIDGRDVAYLRVFSFNVASARPFLSALAARLQDLPQDGLIVDIRGNPGGSIPAAESLLQLLAPRGTDVEPARFALTTTPLTLELCQVNPSFGAWAPSIRDAVSTGEPYSQPLPLTDPKTLAQRLPRYPGPKVLITDALCYSAADIFAAGFQDNELGPVLGTAPNTGAGGANVWTHDMLRLWLPDTLQQLPTGTSFRVALRRSTRVRANAGVPIEDLGVTPDARHALTRRDITESNQDLLAAAASMLSR